MKTMHPEQQQAIKDLETIKTFLAEGQQNLRDTGFHFMFWGLLIPVSLVVFYLFIAQPGTAGVIINAFWPVVCGLGALVSVIAGIRSDKQGRSHSFASNVHSLLWIGILTAIGAVFLVQMLGGKGFDASLLSHIAIILGIGYWIHGSLIQLTWFRFVGLVWILAAIGIAMMALMPASCAMGAATFACSFIPGLILHRSQSRRS